jgi:hypothetical protein
MPATGSAYAVTNPKPTVTSASGKSVKRAGNAVKRLGGDMSRIRQVVREQDEARQVLVLETQQLQLQHDQLTRLLAKTKGTAHKLSDPKAPDRFMRMIEEQKLELSGVQAKINERESALDAQATGAKASAKAKKGVPEQHSEREMLEREIDKWDSRLQRDMKRIGELRCADGRRPKAARQPRPLVRLPCSLACPLLSDGSRRTAPLAPGTRADGFVS